MVPEEGRGREGGGGREGEIGGKLLIQVVMPIEMFHWY